MNSLIRTVEKFSRFLGYISAFFLMLGVLVVCHMVFTRFILNASTSWQTEFVTYILLASTFLGAPWVLLTRGHVNVDLLPLMLGPRARFVLCFFAYSSSALLCFLLTFYSIEFWHEAWKEGWSSDTIWGPKLWKAYIAMPIGFFAISLQYIVEILCLCSGRSAPFHIPDQPTEHQAETTV